MSEAAIPVDLYNPGQVFACLGLMEAAEILLGGAEGRFDWSGGQSRFMLCADGEADPVLTVIAFLYKAKVQAIAPRSSDLKAKEPGVETVATDEGIYPCPAPETPSALPCQLVGPGGIIPISHWISSPPDYVSAELDTVKFWAGMAGYSGAALVRDLLTQVQAWSDNQPVAVAGDPFGNIEPDMASALQSSNLRFDYRSGTIPFDAGFSTNAHGHYAMRGFPLVDLLAAIGLEHARPRRLSSKLSYAYAVWPVTLPCVLARAALGGAIFGFTPRNFRIELGWPGQENQARAIKSAKEEFLS